MHARHRNPGNIVRPNSMEGSVRVPAMYSTDYRNFNRGFGRGSPKPFQPPQPPKKTDIIMEAGRLAAEYLVSQGLLPPNVLPEKWENGGVNNQIMDLQESGSQERENLQLSSEGRTSALARLGNVTPDAGFGRKRFPDEFNAAGSKNNGRGRRKGGPFRCNSSDSGTEYGNAGPLLEKTRSISDIEGADDFGSASNEKQRQGGVKVSGVCVSEVLNNELPLKSENADESEAELENSEFPNDNSSKGSSSNTKKEVPPESEGVLSKSSDDSEVLNMAEVKDGMSETEIDKEHKAAEDYSTQSPVVGEGDEMSESGCGLLRLCTFAKVPTRARSSLPYKSLVVDPVSTTDKENKKCDIPQKGPEVLNEEDSIRGSSSDALTNQTHSSKCFGSDVSRTQSIETKDDVVDLDASIAVDESEKCPKEQSFPGESFVFGEESGQGPPGFGSCSSPVKERGEKRAIENDFEREGIKKPREEWPSSMVIDADEYFRNQTFGAMPSNSYPNRVSHDEEVVKSIDQDRLVEAEPGLELKAEKQICSNSFKICDLNLMEATDMTENHENNSALVLPSTLEAKKEVLAGVTLSSNNKDNNSVNYSRHLIDGKEVIMVDLEDVSTGENKAFDSSNQKTDGVYSGLESFQNNTRSTGDVHDHYGLMMSEFLGTDITNCSTVSTDITSLQTDMGLHNEVGMFCDDDSIYLSLGELPISFQGVWLEKPFG